MKYLDRIGFLCRVQTVHKGHVAVVKHALERAREVSVLIGSSRSSRSIFNPFTYDERVTMFTQALDSSGVSKSDQQRIRFYPLRDDLYNMERWKGSVQEYLLDGITTEDVSIGIISSDKSGDDKLRQDWFPYWETVSVPHTPDLHATQLRNAIFGNGIPDLNDSTFSNLLPSGTIDFLRTFVHTEHYDNLVDEWESVIKYQTPEKVAAEACRKAGLPYYQRTYHTGDAVVFCSGHVLMITRNESPGKGLLALPGGYLNPSDGSVKATALRELKEETKIDVPPSILESSIFDSKTFDHKNRDVRGRLITNAFAIHLPRQAAGANEHPVRSLKGLPRVKGSDDARKAEWIPLSMFRGGENDIESKVYADHYSIIQYFLGRLENAPYK
jgi:bifunctional NMN adenylyltransferase/nudix hydrolase